MFFKKIIGMFQKMLYSSSTRLKVILLIINKLQCGKKLLAQQNRFLLKSDGRRSRHSRRLQDLASATFHFAAKNHLLAGNLGSNLFQRLQVFQDIISLKIEALVVQDKSGDVDNNFLN